MLSSANLFIRMDGSGLSLIKFQVESLLSHTSKNFYSAIIVVEDINLQLLITPGTSIGQETKLHHHFTER